MSRSEMNILEGQQEYHTRQENYRKTTEAVRPCDEDERGAHSEKNARCGHTRENRKGAAKPEVERCMRYDRNGTERGQHNKQSGITWRNTITVIPKLHMTRQRRYMLNTECQHIQITILFDFYPFKNKNLKKYI